VVSVYRLPHSWLRARAQTARLELRAAEHGREKLLARDRAAPAHSQAAAKSTFGSCDDQCGQLLDDVLVGSLSKRFCRREHSRALQPLVANAEYERLGEIPWSGQLGQRPTTWLELEAAARRRETATHCDMGCFTENVSTWRQSCGFPYSSRAAAAIIGLRLCG